MNKQNENKLNNLLNKVWNKKFKVIFMDWPPSITPALNYATELKRNGEYEEALSTYLYCINECGFLATEVARCMAKILCAMNDYYEALLVLITCIQTETCTPRPSESDTVLLRDCIVTAQAGNINPLFNRTKIISGNPCYTMVKSNAKLLQALDKAIVLLKTCKYL